MLGMLMASVFVTVGMISLFALLKNRRAQTLPMLEKYTPMTLAMIIVAASHPTWATIGGALALVYRISVEQAPGGGIGSPNIAFTLAIAIGALLLAAPIALLLRPILAGVLALTLTFILLFGWFLPYFVGA